MSEVKNGWVEVKWDHGSTNSYRMGPKEYDLKLAVPVKPVVETVDEVEAVAVAAAAAVEDEASASAVDMVTSGSDEDGDEGDDDVDDDDDDENGVEASSSVDYKALASTMGGLQFHDEDGGGEDEDVDAEDEDDDDEDGGSNGRDERYSLGEQRVASRQDRGQGWDDDMTLARQFSALVAAFDPRPGRTNVPVSNLFV